MSRKKVTRALISVSDKTGIVELARELNAHGIEIIASDGTAALLRDAEIPVRTVTEVTAAPEILDGKVKTLHPAIHGAILADPTNSAHLAELTAVAPIDLVVVNLYPVDGFDIGGPALIRAAAKNADHVSVLTHVNQYQELIASLPAGTTLEMRHKWALNALVLTAEYDLALARERGAKLRYGENPHQAGTLIVRDSHRKSGVAGAEVLQGKEMSYNNYLDVDIAWRACRSLTNGVAIVKHGIPSGVASANSVTDSYRAALASDPVSAFGGVVAISNEVDGSCAAAISESFTEVVLAPSFTQEALHIFESKPRVRLLRITNESDSHAREFDLKKIDGGYVIQDQDSLDSEEDKFSSWTLVSGTPLDNELAKDLEFAWRIAAVARSNAVVIAQGCRTIGIGAGSVNRLDAARLAVTRAQEHSPEFLAKSVAASDAFFPFPDALDVLVAAGVTSIVQPGGSLNDDAVITAAKAAGITMYLTGIRHFSH